MKKDKCLVPNCPRDRYTRGLCHAHYVGAGKIVRDGLCTWEELEENGKSLPRIVRGGVGPVRQWMLDFKKEKKK